jgi:hypothetical protein
MKGHDFEIFGDKVTSSTDAMRKFDPQAKWNSLSLGALFLFLEVLVWVWVSMGFSQASPSKRRRDKDE